MTNDSFYDPYTHEIQSDEMIPDHIDNHEAAANAVALDAALDSCKELRESLAATEKLNLRYLEQIDAKNVLIEELERTVLRLCRRQTRLENALELAENRLNLANAADEDEGADPDYYRKHIGPYISPTPF
ncbi:MAG: hypothetical protein ACO39X_08175 [Candidatus Nanopelagicaceae bacterium]